MATATGASMAAAPRSMPTTTTGGMAATALRGRRVGLGRQCGGKNNDGDAEFEFEHNFPNRFGSPNTIFAFGANKAKLH